jgi:hypothetical protein
MPVPPSGSTPSAPAPIAPPSAYSKIDPNATPIPAPAAATRTAGEKTRSRRRRPALRSPLPRHRHRRPPRSRPTRTRRGRQGHRHIRDHRRRTSRSRHPHHLHNPAARLAASRRAAPWHGTISIASTRITAPGSSGTRNPSTAPPWDSQCRFHRQTLGCRACGELVARLHPAVGAPRARIADHALRFRLDRVAKGRMGPIRQE